MNCDSYCCISCDTVTASALLPGCSQPTLFASKFTEVGLSPALAMATVASTPFAVSKDLQRPNSPGKIKFICRWGGDLVQDSQGRLAFEGGETRLCTLPKAVRYRELVTKLREVIG